MKNQLPIFMVCENPMIDEHREFVIHMREPYFIAEVIFHDSTENQDTFEKQMSSLEASGEIPTAVIGKGKIEDDPFSVMAIHFFSEINESQINQLNDIINQMTEWYQSYLQWEEENDPFNES